MKFYESEIKMIPGVHLPVRSTLIPLKGRMILITPIDFTTQQLQDIRAQGTVTDIVAPNLFHNLFVEKAVEHFPQANLWGAPGFEKKCPHLPWKKFFGADEWPYGDELEFILVRGAPSSNEVVFFHKQSKTLIVTDLCFNIHRPQGLLTPIIFRLMGTYKRFAISNFWKRIIKDQTAFSDSMQRILEWDFKHIVMAHGKILDTDARQRFRQALVQMKFLSENNLPNNKASDKDTSSWGDSPTAQR